MIDGYPIIFVLHLSSSISSGCRPDAPSAAIAINENIAVFIVVFSAAAILVAVNPNTNPVKANDEILLNRFQLK